MVRLCSWHLTPLTNEARIQPEGLGSFFKQPGRPSASASWIKPIPLSHHNLPPLWRNTQRSCVRITVSSALASAPLAYSQCLTYLHIAPHQTSPGFSQPLWVLSRGSQVAEDGLQMCFEVWQMPAFPHCLIFDCDHEPCVILNLLSRFHLRCSSAAAAEFYSYLCG